MNNKAVIVIAVVAALSTSSASAQWRGNEPCSGKEGVVGSCLNRMATRGDEASRHAQEACASPAVPAMSQAAPSQSPRVAANVRMGR